MQALSQVHRDGCLRVLACTNCAPRKGLTYKNHGCLCVEAYSNARCLADKGDWKLMSSY